MPARIDITGKRFGRLTALEYLGGQRWRCRCDCGKTTTVLSPRLRKGHTKSCGCWKRELAAAAATTHGMDGTPENKAWKGMLSRCYTRTSTRYERYGGRGIKVCDRWRFGEGGKHGFVCFLEDMGLRPTPKHSIDRYPDNDGDYEPGNCRWATWKEQRRNRADVVLIDVNGDKICATDAALRYGIKPAAFHERIRRGWPIERAITEPLRAERGRRCR